MKKLFLYISIFLMWFNTSYAQRISFFVPGPLRVPQVHSAQLRDELRKRLRQCQCGGLLSRSRGPGMGVRLGLEGEVSPVTRCVHADWVWPWPSPKSAVRGGLLTYSYREVSSSMVGRAVFVFCSCSFCQTFWARQAHSQHQAKRLTQC